MKKIVVTAFIISACLFTNSAKADIYYAFIKMVCEPATQTVTISSFHPSGDPEDTVADIRSGKIKDLYYLDDISESHQIITCKLADHKEVSFKGIKSADHPGRDDCISPFFNGAKIPGWFSMLRDVEIKITVSQNGYDIASCSDSPEPHHHKDQICLTKHMVSEKIISRSKSIQSKD